MQDQLGTPAQLELIAMSKQERLLTKQNAHNSYYGTTVVYHMPQARSLRHQPSESNLSHSDNIFTDDQNKEIELKTFAVSKQKLDIYSSFERDSYTSGSVNRSAGIQDRPDTHDSLYLRPVKQLARPKTIM